MCWLPDRASGQYTDKGGSHTKAFHLCLSTKMTSPCSGGGPLIVCPPCTCICHPSMSSVASRRYLTSLLSTATRQRVRVASAAARTACPRAPRPSLTWASALARNVLVDGQCALIQSNQAAPRENRRRLTHMWTRKLNVDALCRTDQIGAG